MGKTKITVEPNTLQISIEREFAAPPAVLLRVYTEPDLLARWLGPRNLTMTVETFEVRDGGRWRYVSVAGDGSEYRFRGVFHGDPSVDGGIVQTFEFEGWPGSVALERLTFTGQGARTVVRSVSTYESVAARDGMASSGMEYGVRDGHERLDELLADIAAPAT